MCNRGCPKEYPGGGCILNNPTEADCEGEPEEDQIIVDGPFPSLEWVARMAGF